MLKLPMRSLRLNCVCEVNAVFFSIFFQSGRKSGKMRFDLLQSPALRDSLAFRALGLGTYMITKLFHHIPLDDHRMKAICLLCPI